MQTGPFTVRIKSDIAALADTISLVYADYPLAPADGFADFHVQVRAPRSLIGEPRCPDCALLGSHRAMFATAGSQRLGAG